MPVVGTSARDLATSILAVPRPVVFFDTAGLLDVLRVPFRQELQVDILASAIRFVEDVRVIPRRVWLVCTENVVKEFQANRESVGQELTARISSLSNSVARLARVAAVVVPEKRIRPLEWLDATVEQRVMSVGDRFVASMSVFRGTSDCVARARDRLWAGLPPASKSKQEFKDCEIFEEFVDLAGLLRRSGFDQPIIFVTPNSSDYGAPPEGHDQIASDLRASSCLYVSNAAWALD